MPGYYDIPFTYDGMGLTNPSTGSLTEIRRRAAREFGPFYMSTVSVTGGVTTLTDTTWPIYSTSDTTDTFIDYYLMRPNASDPLDVVRTVKDHDPLTGVITPDTPWVNAPTAGEIYELHGVIDPGTPTELPQIINEALKRIMIVTEFSFSPVHDQNRHNVSYAAPWLTNPRWIRSVGYLNQGPVVLNTTILNAASIGATSVTLSATAPSSVLPGYSIVIPNADPVNLDFVSVITAVNGATISFTNPLPTAVDGSGKWTARLQLINESRYQVDPYMRVVRGKAIEQTTSNGMSIWIEHPGQVFDPASNTFWVRAISPVYFQCTSQTLGFPIYGLTYESDTAPIPVDWAASAVLVEAWRKYAHLLEPAANQRLIRDRAEAAAWFSDLTAKYFELPPDDFRPLNRWGAWTRNNGPQLWGP